MVEVARRYDLIAVVGMFDGIEVGRRWAVRARYVVEEKEFAPRTAHVLVTAADKNRSPCYMLSVIMRFILD